MKHERKSRVALTIEPSLIDYAERVGRGNVSLGFRHALIEYRDKLDLEVCTKKLSSHPGADCEGAAG